MQSAPLAAAPVELTDTDLETVSGGAALAFFGAALAVGAVVVTAAVIVDNYRNGPMAAGWYNLTH